MRMQLNPWKSDQERISLLDASIRAQVKQRGLYYIRILALLSALYWVVSCLVYGAVYKRSRMVHNALLQIIDLDHGPVGQNITNSVLQIPPALELPRWQLLDRDFDGQLSEVREWVRKHGWGAIVINPGASQRLQQADINYSPKQAITVIHNTGRQPIITVSYLAPALTNAVTRAIYQFTLTHLESLRSQPQLLASNPQLLSTLVQSPISYTSEDVGLFSFSLSPIICIFGFLVGLVMMIEALIQWKMTTLDFFLKVKHWQVWLASFGLVTLWAVFVAMHSALAVAAFQGPQYSSHALPFTVGRFFALWFNIAITLAALGMWLCNWYLVLSPEFFGVPTLITVISNVASLMTDVDLAPHFFRWFRIQPFNNGSMLFQYILSGSYPRIALNVSILLGEWAAMSVILFATTWVRQTTLLLGIADNAGWLRGSIFFHSDIPYYKDVLPVVHKAASFPFEPRRTRSFVISESTGETASLKEGNLGV
ncbi:hypothetical protein LPJ78_005684 [Coemansia sp. RSA 989]|nr:hypothetical protein BX667DRAFT_504082 [Coemansia mojavensis]KAI9467628.1 hypothetical protein BX667DRAFT_504027 [Coemansia mojavensis]KAJ1738423.1 hypothetical protein LPJ68_005560 [Coemansia sp. RSA 1086]KAJ1860790.1 hypothetical protein LPJ78_005684 [Coemansia sp. RSA 989]